MKIVKVSREEFICLLMEAGQSRDNAEFQANVATSLGSYLTIAGKNITIKKELKIVSGSVKIKQSPNSQEE